MKKDEKQKHKSQQSYIASYIESLLMKIVEQSLQTTIEMAMADIFKDWEKQKR